MGAAISQRVSRRVGLLLCSPAVSGTSRGRACQATQPALAGHERAVGVLRQADRGLDLQLARLGVVVSDVAAVRLERAGDE
jgi:hypothetical protein